MNKLAIKATILLGVIIVTTTIAYADKSQEAFERAKALYDDQNKKDIPQAISYCNDAIRLNPKFSEAYAERASLYLDLGQTQKALPDFTTAIRLDPKDGFSYMGRGHIYMEQNDYQKALADYSAAIRIYGGSL